MPRQADAPRRHAELLDYEVMSALAGLSRGRRGGEPKLGKRQVEKAMATFRLLPADRHNTLPLWDRVWELSAHLPARDAQYVALSEALGVTLVTADRRIARAGTARCPIETITGLPQQFRSRRRRPPPR